LARRNSGDRVGFRRRTTKFCAGREHRLRIIARGSCRADGYALRPAVTTAGRAGLIAGAI
jgi:hypothetical protein